MSSNEVHPSRVSAPDESRNAGLYFVTRYSFTEPPSPERLAPSVSSRHRLLRHPPALGFALCLLRLRRAGLQVHHLSVPAAAGHQLVVRPLLYHPAALDDEDAVGVADRAQAVGDHEAG